MERSSRMDKKLYLGFFLATFIYFYLRLIYPTTIEFGYDQPRLAVTVLDFLRNGSFMTLQSYSLATSWGNLSWGPLLVLFNSIFLKLTVNPISISILMIIFNYLSVVFIFITGYKFFNKNVAIVASLIIATHPWWIIFSRMIYQPAPVPTFVSISLFLLFSVIKDHKSKYIFLLVFTWTLLLQSYLITISFVTLSFVILLIETRAKVNYKYLTFGIIISFMLLVPSLKYYIDNPQMFINFLTFKGKFITSYKDSIAGFVQTLSGNNFKWQLGYGYDSFVNSSPYLGCIININLLVFLCLIAVYVYKIILKKNKQYFYILMFLLLPIFTLPKIGVEYVVPRYFLYVIPAFSILIGIVIDSLLLKYRKISITILLLMTGCWCSFTFSYYKFIETFNYPDGFLSNWSDVPYSFLDQSFKWIGDDAQTKGYKSYSVSSDINYPKELRLNWAQRYYWENILNNPFEDGSYEAHYVMYFSPAIDTTGDYKKFGPYVVYEVK